MLERRREVITHTRLTPSRAPEDELDRVVVLKGVVGVVASAHPAPGGEEHLTHGGRLALRLLVPVADARRRQNQQEPQQHRQHPRGGSGGGRRQQHGRSSRERQ